ncbi:heptaprenyl diphosphate synthase component 2 [Alicyclobacillus cellulosilyticus]|uniref:Heptaprenyl diphosphate synthase component 2 n=1 Tax=Alicyclobacillus cellulosilyticus TaxID=1003997 RepID=A0A917NLR2_9BACL|nr:polyprenyl synthetase family protein [Alicyclobacillus cellulosilyticus]GGJ10211.1 heptaprenyl diphosphate synthase component 2 [Alicyclobacillus cellulosilyticus]
MDVREVYARYEPEMRQVDRILREAVASAHPRLTHAAAHLLEAGGKRVRPLLALISSRAGQGPTERVYAAAAALELVHMATLVHDDVIDDADLRRGRPTVRNQYGDRAAMYTGDFLFARAIQLLSRVADVEVHREMSDVMVRICEGEIEQIEDFFNWQQSVRDYLRRVERKTALLIAASCAVGAMVSGAAPEAVRRLRRFGYYTGMAFQVIDDILDIVGDEQELGKPVGGDLRQGNLTLPALVAAQTGAREALRSLVKADVAAEEAEAALQLVRTSPGVSVARRVAERYMAKAMRELDAVALPFVRRDLAAVARFLNQRRF